MFGIKKLALVAPMAALALVAAPVSAAGGGGGVVDGAVSVAPGIPATGSSNDTVAFSSTVLTGVLTNGSQSYAGAITCGANGGGVDTAAEGTGSVTVGCSTSSPAVGSISCNLSGPYLRVGVVVKVDLTTVSGQCTINGQAFNGNVHVAALFIPDATSGTSVTGAIFAGAFVADDQGV